MNVVAENVRRFRYRRGLTQVELGELCGIAQGRISDLETGRHIPQLPTMIRVAGALGVEVPELFVEPNGHPSEKTHERIETA
jgi:transcriptional regulator with XRE-family HTH domain